MPPPQCSKGNLVIMAVLIPSSCDDCQEGEDPTQREAEDERAAETMEAGIPSTADVLVARFEAAVNQVREAAVLCNEKVPAARCPAQ